METTVVQIPFTHFFTSPKEWMTNRHFSFQSNIQKKTLLLHIAMILQFWLDIRGADKRFIWLKTLFQTD